MVMSEWGVLSEVPSPMQTKVSLDPEETGLMWLKQLDFRCTVAANIE